MKVKFNFCFFLFFFNQMLSVEKKRTPAPRFDDEQSRSGMITINYVNQQVYPTMKNCFV